MDLHRGNRAVTVEDAATLARAAGLDVEAARLETLAGLLAAAFEAVDRASVAASRVDLEQALAFDPAWTDEERGA